MATRFTFTPASIDAIRNGRQSDPQTPGLAIEVLGSGKKRWRYRRQVAGKPAVATLFGGLYPVVPIAAARDWARELNAQVEVGVDPRVEGIPPLALAP